MAPHTAARLRITRCDWRFSGDREPPKRHRSLCQRKCCTAPTKVLRCRTTSGGREPRCPWATSTVPIVLSAAPDPVGFGLVASLARPGANVTGMNSQTSELGAKSVEILKEAIPKARRPGYLVNPSNPSKDAEAGSALAAARALGVDLRVLPATSERELDETFAALKAQGIEGVVVSPDPFFDSRRDRIVALAARYSVPAKYAWREPVLAGGLISYGASIADSYRRGGGYWGGPGKGGEASRPSGLRP